mmetsp:Transcript_114492/g.296671  ORF Transcript_114492/g.296671 Transcript_114492/m.296671 type:complete len:491 (+) Transcript_114492:99-1571(+)
MLLASPMDLAHSAPRGTVVGAEVEGHASSAPSRCCGQAAMMEVGVQSPTAWPRAAAPEPPHQQEQALLLEVFSLAGAPLCRLRCTGRTTIAAVKRRIARHHDIPAAEQRLVHAGEVLKDAVALEQCCILGTDLPGVGGRISVQCVRTGQSNLARGVQEMRGSHQPDEAVEAALGGVVDTVLRAEHSLAERLRPRGAADLERAIEGRHRAELINWMVQAFEVLKFDDAILHSVVLTLDRYYAIRALPIEVGSIQKLLLSAVCTEMKLAGAEEFPPGHWQRVLSHLCHGRVALKAILETEYEVLSRLGFQVGIPTAVTFLRELALRPHAGEVGQRAADVAMFFLEMAVFDPNVQYGRPLVLLAAGALSAALRVLEVRRPELAAELAEARESALEDLTVYDVEQFQSAEKQALQCEEELLQLWLSNAERNGDTIWGLFYPQLEAKFSRRGAVPGSGAQSAMVARAALERLGEARATGCATPLPRGGGGRGEVL